MVNTVIGRFYNNKSVFKLKRVISCNPENNYFVAEHCRKQIVSVVIIHYNKLDLI